MLAARDYHDVVIKKAAHEPACTLAEAAQQQKLGRVQRDMREPFKAGQE